MLACLAYIDLNPIHAGIAISPESSDFTSGQERVRAQISKDKLNQLRKKYHAKSQEAKKDGKIDKIMNENGCKLFLVSI